MSLEVVLVVAWAALVAGACVRRRPVPARVRALARNHAGAEPSRLRQPVGAAVTEQIGRAARTAVLTAVGGHRAPSRGPPAADDSRRLGLALLVGAAVALVGGVVVAVPAALVAWAAPGVHGQRAARRQAEAIADGLPDAVDLLVLAVDAGLTVPLALEAVVRRGRGPLVAELQRVVAEIRLGRRVGDALDDLPARAGESVRPLVAALAASDRYGAPLTASLLRLADDVRMQRRRRAEEAARRVPVKLLFPLVACTLPAFGLLTVAPLVASALGSLRL